MGLGLFFGGGGRVLFFLLLCVEKTLVFIIKYGNLLVLRSQAWGVEKTLEWEALSFPSLGPN